MKLWGLAVSLLFLVSQAAARLGNPYLILGLSESATTQDIKRAYKSLVREWHPDKNSAPNAQEKFVELTEAYKLLTDKDRKEYFDSTGRTDYNSGHGFQEFHPFNKFGQNPHMFDSFFGFNKQDVAAQAFYNKQSINLRQYETKIVPDSQKKAFIVLFYTSKCRPCTQLLPIWQRLSEELIPVNFGVQTIDAGVEEELSRKIGVKSVPYIALILDGHPYHYTQASISMASLIEFTKSKFPHNIVRHVTQDNLESFLGGWLDNKVRVLLFGRLDIIRMRYLAIAWEFRDYAVVGYVQMGTPESEVIRTRYGVSSTGDSLVVLLEDDLMPASSVTTIDLAYDTMRAIIDANKFLLLPRLSSQSTLDALCPIEATYSRRRLCAVLVTQNNRQHDASRDALRKYAVSERSHRLTYTYIFKEKQINFVNALTNAPGSPVISDLHIVLIWRNDRKHIRYEWISEEWLVGSESHNKSKESLRKVVDKLLHTNEPMPYEAEIQELFDEHAQGIFWRILTRLSRMLDYLQDKITSDEIITASSVVATMLFIVCVCYFMSYLVKLEEERIKEKGEDLTGGKKCSSSPQLKVHEMRGESYYGLVRFLKPGCRTIVLLCDNETKTNLLQQFHKACWPYRKNKTLMFAFLNIERQSSMGWYKKILTLGLLESRELVINPKNTIGTVLSLNGHRKYYCIYHAKHPEDARVESALIDFAGGDSTLKRRIPQYGETGNFMGFSESDSDMDSDPEIGDRRKDSIASNRPLLNYYSKVLFEDQLLEGLNNWLDRLFEGTTHRYAINFWPDWPGK